jgi:hypothetical protein
MFPLTSPGQARHILTERSGPLSWATPFIESAFAGPPPGHEARPKMSINEIVNEIIRLVSALDTNGGHFHDEPYKGDFFSFVYCGLGRGLAQAYWTEIFEARQLDQHRR